VATWFMLIGIAAAVSNFMWWRQANFLEFTYLLIRIQNAPLIAVWSSLHQTHYRRYCSSVERMSALLYESEQPSLNICLWVNLTVLGLTNIWFPFVFNSCIILDFFALKAYRICLVFLFCNIHTQNGYHKKGIHQFVADFLGCNNTVCY